MAEVGEVAQEIDVPVEELLLNFPIAQDTSDVAGDAPVAVESQRAAAFSPDTVAREAGVAVESNSLSARNEEAGLAIFERADEADDAVVFA